MARSVLSSSMSSSLLTSRSSSGGSSAGSGGGVLWQFARTFAFLVAVITLVRIQHVSNLHTSSTKSWDNKLHPRWGSAKQEWLVDGQDGAEQASADARRLEHVAPELGISEEFPCKKSTHTLTKLPAFYRTVELDVSQAVTNKLHSLLCDIQTSTSVQTRAAVFADDGQLDRTHCGIGCRLMRVVMDLWLALADHKPLYSARQAAWEYTDGRRCAPRNEECYFQKLATSPLSPAIEAHMSAYNSTGLHDVVSKVARDGLQVMTRRSLDTFREAKFGKNYLDQVLQKADLRKSAANGCYLSAQMLRFIAVPHAKLDKLVDEAKAKMRWNEGGCIVAMHVRMGWRAATNSRLWPDEYMAHVKRMGCKRVLIITENQKVIDEAHQKYPEYEFLYTDYPRDNHKDIGAAMQAGDVSQEPEALNALLNLYLSADCQYHVGTHNSTWFRLMLMLAMAKLGHLPAFAFVGDPRYFLNRNGKWGFFGMCDKEELMALVKKNYERFPKSQMRFQTG